ncbi:MAG: DUF1284 domain-containing protein [Rhodospirillales bacterium]|nr:DUF1284 domain-containing protein [Rhodospirillales bacterium]
MPGLTPINLRPHHLLCILTYVGEGYSPAFVENFNTIVARLNQGTPVKIVKGPDDICAPLVKNPPADYHCEDEDHIALDNRALEDIINFLGNDVSYGSILRLPQQMVKKLRLSFSNNDIRNACAGCQWHDLCSKVSQSNYKDTLLHDDR